jgi:uncharacterized membrane protein (DUF106 family)
MASAPSSGRPARPDFGNQLITLMAFLFMMYIMFTPSLRAGLGKLVGIPLSPLIGFDGELVMLTLLFAGLLTSIFTISVRHLFMDWIGQARTQRITSAFQKEMREARLSNNTYKIKKLQDIQPQILSQSMKSSQTQLKLMPVTMIVVIPIFAWLATFLYADVSSTAFAVPWAFNTNLISSNIFPNWIILYSLLTLPFGQVFIRTLKYFSFRKRLKGLETQELEGPAPGEVGDEATP